MPSVARGFQLDLALAGSKVGLIEPTFNSYGGSMGGGRISSGGTSVASRRLMHHASKPATETSESLPYNQTRFAPPASSLLGENSSPSRRTAKPTSSKQLDGISLKTTTNTTDNLLQPGHQQVNHVDPLGSGSSQWQGEIRYTNRQRILLEQEGNTRHGSAKDLKDVRNTEVTSHLPLRPPVELVALDEHLTLKKYNQCSSHSPKIGNHRPFSSYVDGDCLSKNALVISDKGACRHHSDTRLSGQEPGILPQRRTQSFSDNLGQVIDEDDPEGRSTGKDTDKIHTDLRTLNWQLSPPGSDQTAAGLQPNGQRGSLPSRAASPQPPGSDPASLASSPPASPFSDSHLSWKSDNNSASAGLQPLPSGRELLDAVAHENKVIKQELDKSLTRLLQRALRSAGSVSQAEIQSIREQLRAAPSNRSRPSAGSSKGRPKAVSSEGRRGSVNSQDSGISSDNIGGRERLKDEISPGSAYKESPTEMSLHDQNLGKDAVMLHSATLSALKSKRKKSAMNKLKKHKSKKGRHKHRAEARSSKKRTAEQGNPTSPLQSSAAMHLQAFCRPMQVLPSAAKPRPEKVQVSAPSQPLRVETAAIYNKRLPRMLQPTAVCDGGSLREALADVTQSFPNNRKGLNSLTVTKVSAPANGTVGKSLTETTRVYGGAAGVASASVAGEQTRLTKVFLSEKQSGMLSELGLEFPCAPPVTPLPELLKKIDFVPSMYDIRAQRAVKAKLEVMERQDKKRKEKQLAQQIKMDKVNQKERERDLKRQQRLQIYALNKVMTAWEHSNFTAFCAANGIPCDL